MSLSQMVQPKRGYLANILSIPPLIYPFQYNPTRLTDSKSNKLAPLATKIPPSPSGGLGDLAAGVSAALSFNIGDSLINMARAFSNADLQTVKEGDRTLTLQIVIDGRETRAGEPARRRNSAGDILADLAILRSFVYPQVADLTQILASALSSKDRASTFLDAWFNSPPTALLIMGDLSVEGFMTDLKITETAFNSDLDPTRAEVEITLVEKINSLSFVADSVKRIGRTFVATAYEDIGDVII